MRLRDIRRFLPKGCNLRFPGSCEFEPGRIIAIEVSSDQSSIRMHFPASTIELILSAEEEIMLYDLKNAILAAANGTEEEKR